MATRIITSIFGLIIFFAAFFADSFYFAIAVAIVGAGMVYEAVSAICNKKSVVIFSVFLSIIFLFGNIILRENARGMNLYNAEAVNLLTANSLRLIVLLAFAAIYVLISVFSYLLLAIKEFKNVDVHKIFSSAFMNMYITIFMSFIMDLRFDFGRYAVLAVFIFAWLTDTGAYFTGSFLGKHKLAPNLSPKKTIEGAVGGVITTVISALVYIIILKKCFNIILPNNVIFIIAAAICSVLSMLGDLCASAVKRHCGVKDFGNIFPGHGGFLDRFDSVVFIAPFVYFVFFLMEYSSLLVR